ncbi:MAG: hypothetical protein KGI71_05855 [Patescibacteria group bacterium]|nr:hypothetical protein [Patescibacteria group bacterium]
MKKGPIVTATCAGCGKTIERPSHKHRDAARPYCSNSCRAIRTPGVAAVLRAEGSTRLLRTRTYGCWAAMKSRCSNKRAHNYADYGGRGIVVCDQWQIFENFALDMGPMPTGKSLDRIDNDGPYAPWNCRWATQTQQNRNQRFNRRLTFRGQTKCLAEWAETVGISVDVIGHRIDELAWPLDRALTEPPRVQRNSRHYQFIAGVAHPVTLPPFQADMFGG